MVRILIFLTSLALAGCGQTTASTEEEPAETYSTTEIFADDSIDPIFIGRDIGDGLYVEYPRHWYVLNVDQSANVSASGAALAEAAGFVTQGKRTLLAVNATPAPTGAMIRVSVISRATVSQAELEQIIRNGGEAELLQVVRTRFEADFPPMMARAGIEVTEVAQPQLVSIANRPTVLIAYKRNSAVDGAAWEVRMYQIASGDRTIELTLSNRVSDRAIWTPILDRTLSTLSVR